MNDMNTNDRISKWTNGNYKEDYKDCEIYKEYEECWEVNREQREQE